MSRHSAGNLPIAVLISGGGTTLKNLIDRQVAGQLPVEFKLVVSSKSTARGLELAEASAIPSEVVARKDFADPNEHSKAVFDLCRTANVDFVVMGGYLEHLLIPEDFENRVVNIHPSLIPAFSGKGFYGMRVHKAVLDYGAKISGCTVHFVDNEFDHGPIIAQQAVPVEADDSPEALQARVFEKECELLPRVLSRLAEGKLSVSERKVTLR